MQHFDYDFSSMLSLNYRSLSRLWHWKLVIFSISEQEKKKQITTGKDKKLIEKKNFYFTSCFTEQKKKKNTAKLQRINKHTHTLTHIHIHTLLIFNYYAFTSDHWQAVNYSLLLLNGIPHCHEQNWF